jgi:DNA-binding NtrC family response regulator
MESEFFGHEKGSFTGAVDSRKGYFETVNGGTLFMDEIGEMPLGTQARLLRVLENSEFIRVGSSKMQKTDVRVIAATNKDLLEATQGNKFREDLYYRLNTVPIRVPSLRERKEDILLLFRKFAVDFAEKYRTTPIQLAEEARTILLNYPWPGNVRELSNLVDRFNTLFSGQKLFLNTVPASLLPKGLRSIQAERASSVPQDIPDLEVVQEFERPENHSANADVMNPFANPAPPMPLDLHNEVEDIIMLAQGLPSLPPEGLSLKDRLADIEKDLIVQALNRTDGNVSQTARLLNLQRTTLIEKLNKYDLRQGSLPVNAAVSHETQDQIDKPLNLQNKEI